MENNWYKEHTPFFIEVEFDKMNDETQLKLLSAVMKNEEILPGLKIKRLFNQITDQSSIIMSDMLDDYKKVQQVIQEFSDKWSNKNRDHKIEKQVEVNGKSSLTDKEKIIYNNNQREKDFNKNTLESDWIEMKGNSHSFPDMIF